MVGGLQGFRGAGKGAYRREFAGVLASASGRAKAVLGGLLLLWLSTSGVAVVCQPLASVDDAYMYLNQVMDRPVDSFWIYDDFISGHNRAVPSGYMGDAATTLEIRENWTDGPYDGVSCIRVVFTPQTETDWAGVYWQVVENNWGQLAGVGVDLTGATRVRFRAKSDSAGANVEFFTGGIGWPLQPYPDSFPKKTTEPPLIALGENWTSYDISLAGADLSHVIGPFGFALNAPNNPQGATFFLDYIEVDSPADPDTPRFLPSYKVQGVGSPDLYITNSAFLYDQALVALAYVARRTEDDLRRARIILDAMTFALENDRAYTDGRLRNSYMSGWLRDRKTGKARLPGWYDSDTKSWFEDRIQVGTHSGNLAWTIIALLHYNEIAPKPEYVQAAVGIARWLEENVKDMRGEGGYAVGYEGWEPTPQPVAAKSTEQNIDLVSAFGLLQRATGDNAWLGSQAHAARFLSSMWLPGSPGHFALGTWEDGVSIRDDSRVLDPQSWSILAGDVLGTAQPEGLLQWIEENLVVTVNDIEGVDFNDDKDGIWPEGCGQFALANSWVRKEQRAEVLLRNLQTFQGPEGGFWAASKDYFSTSLTWEYFHRVALAPTAWYIFASQSWNPFVGAVVLPFRVSSVSAEWQPGGQEFLLMWTSTKGKSYQVMATSDILNVTAWEDIGELRFGTGSMLEYRDPIAESKSRIFRVREN